MKDPRDYQICVLGSLLAYGTTVLDFEVSASRAVLLLGTSLLTQYAASRLARLPRYDPRSALISGLSLCLLLRTSSAAIAVATVVVAILSKFVIRVRGKHVFNPTNFGIVLMMGVTGRVWVSPGQWGSVALFGFLMACLGGLVVNRAARSDVTFAFLLSYMALVFGRSLWLGEPMTIPIHRLESGAFLLFSFFMISDPKTTPDRRAGRILFAMLVALGAYHVTFRMFRTNGLLWSLALLSPLVPLIDLLLPGRPYTWAAPRLQLSKGAPPMTRASTAAAAVLLAALLPTPASAFCGFFVAKADTKLFNKASQVVLVRDGDRTVLTMVNDFKGDVRDFAIVVPVPTVLEEGQIHAGERDVVDHLDAYSAPRLVEYHDPDPCMVMAKSRHFYSADAAAPAGAGAARAKSLGVTIEARYTVGEYDILILSAEQSGGLETWLREEGYRIPAGASEVLGSYIKQNLKFFVARVNLTEHDKLGFSYLRPLQIAYESPKFMLPIRLGMVNADGTQDLFIFALTQQGRVETTNYRTVRLPSDMDVPLYVKEEFPAFYRDMFTHQWEREDRRAVFVEYAWDMAWCDPCAAEPLTSGELRKLGVFWVDGAGGGGGAQNVFVTRLHLRYDRQHFPEDLVLQQTADRTNFQGRYVLRHPFDSKGDCPEWKRYEEQLRERQRNEATNLAELTGWRLEDIHRKMSITGASSTGGSWWDRLWGGE